MKSLFLCALLYVLLNGTMQAYQLSAEKKATLNQTLQSWVDSFKYAGIINLTSFHGTIDHFEAFGFRDLESRAPLKTDTLVRIYSMVNCPSMTQSQITFQSLKSFKFMKQVAPLYRNVP